MHESKSYFVGIGAAKAGTTWLHSYLLNHPEVCICPMKELHYFDAQHIPNLVSPYRTFASELKRLAQQLVTDEREAAIKRISLIAKRLEMDDNPKAYRDYFENLLLPHQSVFGEITPSYSMLGKRGFEAILEMYPDAKFILIMRNPVDRFWSQLRFTQKVHPEFSPEDSFSEKLNDPGFIERGNYGHTLESLQAAGVPDRNLFTTFYEHLFGSEGVAEIERLNRFLGISSREPRFYRINESPQIGLPADFRKEIALRLRDVYDAVLKRYPNLPDNWTKDLEMVASA